MLMIHSIFVMLLFFSFFFLYFTYSISILDSLQIDVISSNGYRSVVRMTQVFDLEKVLLLDFLSTIVEQKSLAKLIIFFIGISNKLITLLAVFLFSLLKRLYMVIIPLKDIEIFLGMN